MNVLGFFHTIWLSFLNDLRPAEQFLAVLTIAGPVFVIATAIRHYYKGRNKNLSRELEEEKDAARKWLREYNKTREDLDHALRHLPENWQQKVKAERKDGNEERALGFLRDEMRNLAKPVAEAADELARYHASVAPDLGPSHWLEAQHYCRIALLVGGKSVKRERLLVEIDDALAAEEETLHREDFTGWEDLFSAFPHAEDAEELVLELNNRTFELNRDQGQYQLAANMNRRALLIMARNGLQESPIGLISRFHKAECLELLGHYEEALQEIDTLMPLQRDILPQGHRITFVTRHLRASVLNALGRDEEALQEIDDLALLLDNAVPNGDPDRFATRHLRAKVLMSIGHHEEALQEIDAYIPLQINALRDGHPHTFVARQLRASVLNSLGRHEEALQEIDGFAPSQTKALPQGHPETLVTRNLRTRVLNDLGRHEEALQEINDFALLLNKALPDGHPHKFAVFHLRARILSDLGRHAEALQEIDDFAPSQIKALPHGHPDIKHTEELRAEVENALRNERSRN